MHHYNNLTESAQDLKTHLAIFSIFQKNIYIKSHESIKNGILLGTTKGINNMSDTLLIIILVIFAIITVATLTMVIGLTRRMGTLEKNTGFQYNILVKIQNLLKSKSATNAVAEHAEMIYQDLLQNLIPILAALDIMPRNTSEHPLWRTLGGLIDEYAKNPFVMEKLRRAIKLDSEVKRNVSNYMDRADNLLKHLSESEPEGILTKTFLNGLLGQSLTFFTQAYQLATTDDENK